MSTNDYIKYITQTFVKHFDMPKTTRKEIRMQRKMEKSPFLNRWFGMIPMAIWMIFKRK
ncbi:YqzE family protein [Bacillus sp. FJAT-49736]|uniref:YqzE family protein n=1 Tax=Bacillus sp. FJAT-49736 TaxID=2833582 RepID=UPI001BC990A5|nr:YqzE family protein [Bacillus sp. FJAT-49736]MBS4173448.1 YqzE family protein [Bacillus sp. FJAT-49736]